jgi:hypothetical protein
MLCGLAIQLYSQHPVTADEEADVPADSHVMTILLVSLVNQQTVSPVTGRMFLPILTVLLHAYSKL